MIDRERDLTSGEVDREFIKVGRDGGIVWHREVMLENEVKEYEPYRNNPIYKHRIPKVIREDYEILSQNTSVMDLSPRWEEKRLQKMNKEQEEILHEGELIQVTKDKTFPEDY